MFIVPKNYTQIGKHLHLGSKVCIAEFNSLQLSLIHFDLKNCLCSHNTVPDCGLNPKLVKGLIC